MSAPENPRAFPSGAIDPAYGGMTLRDWFAGQATEADIDAHRDYGDDGFDVLNTREAARYAYADAMLAERAKVQP